jgi:hypothetical protein
MAARPVGELAEDRSIGVGAVMSAGLPGGKLPGPGMDDLSANEFVLRLLIGTQLRRLREQPDGDRPGRVQGA